MFAAFSSNLCHPENSVQLIIQASCNALDWPPGVLWEMMFVKGTLNFSSLPIVNCLTQLCCRAGLFRNVLSFFPLEHNVKPPNVSVWCLRCFQQGVLQPFMNFINFVYKTVQVLINVVNTNLPGSVDSKRHIAI